MQALDPVVDGYCWVHCQLWWFAITNHKWFWVASSQSRRYSHGWTASRLVTGMTARLIVLASWPIYGYAWSLSCTAIVPRPHALLHKATQMLSKVQEGRISNQNRHQIFYKKGWIVLFFKRLTTTGWWLSLECSPQQKQQNGFLFCRCGSTTGGYQKSK